MTFAHQQKLLFTKRAFISMMCFERPLPAKLFVDHHNLLWFDRKRRHSVLKVNISNLLKVF